MPLDAPGGGAEKALKALKALKTLEGATDAAIKCVGHHQFSANSGADCERSSAPCSLFEVVYKKHRWYAAPHSIPPSLSSSTLKICIQTLDPRRCNRPAHLPESRLLGAVLRLQNTGQRAGVRVMEPEMELRMERQGVSGAGRPCREIAWN